MSNGEYRKRCDCCHQNVQARSFWRQLFGRFPWLCKECWEKADTTGLGFEMLCEKGDQVTFMIPTQNIFTEQRAVVVSVERARFGRVIRLQCDKMARDRDGQEFMERIFRVGRDNGFIRQAL